MRRFLLMLAALAPFVLPSVTEAGTTATRLSRAGTQVPLSDAQIEATLRAKLAKSKVGADGFKFRVQKGVVYWDGSTNVAQHKGASTRMAHTAGALQVVNNIKVSAEGRAKASAGLHHASVQAP
jgi:osmotically-inducible protein OsmY